MGPSSRGGGARTAFSGYTVYKIYIFSQRRVGRARFHLIFVSTVPRGLVVRRDDFRPNIFWFGFWFGLALYPSVVACVPCTTHLLHLFFNDTSYPSVGSGWVGSVPTCPVEEVSLVHSTALLKNETKGARTPCATS